MELTPEEERAEVKMKRLLSEGGVIETYNHDPVAHLADGSTQAIALVVIRMRNGSRHHILGVEPQSIGIQVPKQPRAFKLSVDPSHTSIQLKQAT